jgi:hypothetical protein
VSPILEEFAVAPQQAFELGDLEPAPQPAPQDEMLRACDDGGRIHLDHAEAVDGFDEGRRSRPGQQLTRHRELARVSSGEAEDVGHAERLPGVGDGLLPCTSLARWGTRQQVRELALSVEAGSNTVVSSTQQVA